MTTRTARYALAVIAVANFFSYLDRQLVSALEAPIRKAFSLESDAFGLLWTLFTLGYLACSPFIGYLSDRYRRPRIFAVCIFIWSLATIASGMAQSTWVLYTARVLIGLGEAGCLVIGSSLIADFFSQESRGKALSIFYLGLPLGGTFAFIMSTLEGPLGWRNLFYIAGLPGFVLCILLWMMTDPPRGGEDPAGGHRTKGGLRDYVRLLKTPSLLYIILAQACAVVILVPLTHYGVEFFTAARGMGREEARLTLGIIALVAGVAGNTAAGFVGDRLARRFRGAYAGLASVSFLVGFPMLFLGLQVESRWVFLPALTVGAFCLFVCMPAVNTHIANVTLPHQRAMAWALAVFVLHLLGDTLAAPVFGLVERGFKDSALAPEVVDPRAREMAFLWFTFALVPAALCSFLAARNAARDMARAS